MSTVHEEEKTDGRYVIAGTRSLERANMLGSDVGTKLPKYRTAGTCAQPQATASQRDLCAVPCGLFRAERMARGPSERLARRTYT